jgi:hypothetical protein
MMLTLLSWGMGGPVSRHKSAGSSAWVGTNYSPVINELGEQDSVLDMRDASRYGSVVSPPSRISRKWRKWRI